MLTDDYIEPTGFITYVHEGVGYHVDYEWHPSDAEAGLIESIDVLQVTRNDEAVEVSPVLLSKMTGAALRHARLTEGGTCRRVVPGVDPWLPAPPPRRPAPVVEFPRAQTSSGPHSDRR